MTRKKLRSMTHINDEIWDEDLLLVCRRSHSLPRRGAKHFYLSTDVIIRIIKDREIEAKNARCR